MTIRTSTQKYSRYIPQRTCIACREVKAKSELVRLVHTVNGEVEIDSLGRKTGRGAYLCRSAVCWDTGLNKHRLDRALKKNISTENRVRLAELAKSSIHGCVLEKD